MAYLYQVSFNVKPEVLSKEKINVSLKKVLGYMKTLLPSQTGFIDARSLLSLNEKNNTYVVCISEWEYWENLEEHRKSNLSEEKILEEFGSNIKKKDLIIRIYKEVY
jgi:heme-degrading monooxygenase HmoA